MSRMQAEQRCDPHAFHGEGPVWWPEDGSSAAGRLRYVDLMAGRILTMRDDGDVDVLDVPGPVAAFFRPRRSGGIVVGAEHAILISDDATAPNWRTLATLIDDPAVRLNDGGCDPVGSLYAGSMRYDQATGGARLYEVTATGAVTGVLDDVTISNGIAWSPAGDRAYYNDTPTGTTWVFDWTAEAGLHHRRAAFTVDGGGPDGLCVDAEGNVWTAVYGGSRVEGHAPDGRLIERIELPVTNITACTFGGADLSTLYITTTRENVPDGEQPEAGAVFSAVPGTKGRPASLFAG